jgi:hypothetical protein
MPNPSSVSQGRDLKGGKGSAVFIFDRDRGNLIAMAGDFDRIESFNRHTFTHPCGLGGGTGLRASLTTVDTPFDLGYLSLSTPDLGEECTIYVCI